MTIYAPGTPQEAIEADQALKAAARAKANATCNSKPTPPAPPPRNDTKIVTKPSPPPPPPSKPAQAMSNPPSHPLPNYAHGLQQWTQQPDGSIVNQTGYNFMAFSNLDPTQQATFLSYAAPMGTLGYQGYSPTTPMPALTAPAHGCVMAIGDAGSDVGSAKGAKTVAKWVDNVNKSRGGNSAAGSVKISSVKAPSVKTPSVTSSVKASSASGSRKADSVQGGSHRATPATAHAHAHAHAGNSTTKHPIRTRACDLCRLKTQLRLVEANGQKFVICVKCAGKAFQADGIARWRRGVNVQE